MSLESIVCFGRPGEELRMLISIVVLGDRSLLTPEDSICHTHDQIGFGQGGHCPSGRNLEEIETGACCRRGRPSMENEIIEPAKIYHVKGAMYA